MADPNQLTGRALDEACAIALGHKIEALENGARVMSRSIGSVATRVARYSSASSTLDEKLAWLACRDRVCINTDATVTECFLDRIWHGGERPLGQGRDIHEAIARLVVAVKVMEKRQTNLKQL